MKPKSDSETRTIKFINLKTDCSRWKKKDINCQCYKRSKDITTDLREFKKDSRRLFWTIFANKFDQLDENGQILWKIPTLPTQE